MKKQILFKSIFLLISLSATIFFKAHSQTNIAPSAAVSAFGNAQAPFQWNQINDLNIGTCGAQQSFVWTAAPPDGTEWMLWEWTNPQRIQSIIIHHGQTTGRFLAGGVVQTWNGTTYVNAHTFSGLNQANCINTITLPNPLTTTRIRITNFVAGAIGQNSNLNFREIEIISAPPSYNDAGVLSIDSPVVFTAGLQPVVARIRNFGLNQITSVNVNWELNGVAQTPATYTGLLDTIGGSGSNFAFVNLGMANFMNNQLYRIKAWTSSPNSQLDTINTNDTTVRLMRSPLNGSYTIGKNNCNFLTINEAASILTNVGVSGPVFFNLCDTLYDTASGETFPINLTSTSGMSATNTVTFKPLFGNNVLINANAATPLFVLNNARNFIIDGRDTFSSNFRSLTFQNTNNSSAATIINLQNDAISNTIRNAVFRFSNTSTTTGAINILGSTFFNGNDSNRILNNYISRNSVGTYATGIVSQGQSNIIQNNNNTISGNDFNGFTFNGIQVNATNNGNGSNWLISNNNFYDTAANTTQLSTWSAINFVPGTASNSINNQILNNIIGGNTAQANGGALNNATSITRVPIQVTVANGTATRVYGNQIKNWVLSNPTATLGFTAIQLSGGIALIDSNYIGDLLSLNNAAIIGVNAIPSSNYDITRNIISNISAYNIGTTNAIRGITTSSGQVVNIQNNIIKGLRTNSGNTGSTTGASLVGIGSSSTSNSILISGNQIGTLAEPLSNNNNSTSAVRMIGIMSTSGVSTIENNTIDGLFMDSTGSTSIGSTTSAAINGILNFSGTAGQVIRNNRVTHLYQRSNQATQATQINGICYASGGFTSIQNNIVYGLFSRSSNTSTSTSAALNGINFGSSGIALVTNNYIDSLAMNPVIISSSQINGIVMFGSTGNRVSGNQIKSIYNFFTTSSPGICGIQYISSAVNQECDSNVIWGLYNLHNATTGSIIGIRYFASTSIAGNESYCNRNFIHSFASAGTSTTNILGIDLQSMHGTVANNLIRLGIDTAGVAFTGPFVVSGINNNHSSTTFINRILHNTVYIGGAPTSGSSITAAYRSFIGFISWSDIRNNIFVNLVQNNGGTGSNYAINYGSTASTNLFVCNYNVLWAGSGLTNNFIGGGPGNAEFMTGLNGWKRLSLRDGNSIHANPGLIAPNALPGLINLRPATNNPGEGAGDPTITQFAQADYTGTMRSAGTPVDIGAYASPINTLSFDSVAPEINYTLLTNTSSILNRTFSATIVDRNSGVANGTFAPKLYFNKNFGTWFSVNGTLVSGNSRNGVWEFTTDYSLLGGVLPNDIIRYYIAAQDSANNYSTSPAYAVATDINNIINHVGTPNQYQISTPIPLNITVGPTGTYTSLTGPTGLFNAINNSLLQGNTEVVLENGATITELGNVALNQWLETNGTSVGNFGYTLTIRPAGPNQTILTGNVTNTDGLLRLNGSDRVRILGYANNGTVNDTTLVIRNFATSQPALTILNDATNIFIQSVIFETSNTGTGVTNGGALRISQSSIATGNDNVYIGNSIFRRTTGGGSLPGILLAASGTTGVNRENENLLIENSVFYGMNLNSIAIGSGMGNNLRIKNNVFFQDTLNIHNTSPTVINFTPGNLSNNDTIVGNIIGGNWYGLNSTWHVSIAAAFTGINVTSGAVTGTYIANNRVANVLMNNISASTFTAIQVNNGGGVATILNNYVGDTLNPLNIINSGSTSTMIGISCQTGSNSIINNNIVSGLVNNSTASNTATVNGIRAWNQTGLLQINSNLISNLRDSSGSTSSSISAQMIGISISSSTTSIQVNSNTIRNLSNRNTGIFSFNQTIGIVTSSGLASITNNLVEDIRTNVQNTSTSTGAGLIGIWNSSFNPGQVINNNIVRHLNYNTIFPSTTQAIGIMQSSGSGHFINNNTVHNIKSNTTSSNTSVSSGIIGLMHNGSGSQINMNQNTVFALEGQGTSGNVNIIGLLYQGTTTNVVNNVNRNFIHSFKLATSGFGRMIGIQQNSGSFTRYTNNMIRLGIDSAGILNAGGYEVYGFLNDVSGNFEYFHNSVYLGGAPTSGIAVTACIRMNGTPTGTNINDIRNNIFVNATSNGTTATGKHYALRFPGLPTNPTSLVSNYNILQATGTGGFVGGTNLIDYTTLGGLTGWARNTAYDLQSGSANPQFVNPTGDASSIDLHLQLTNPAEASGDLSLTVVVDDFDGNNRATNGAVDVGADAGNFTLSTDIFPPRITYTPINNQGNLFGPLTISGVVIRDNVGMPLNLNTSSPRVYYKKGLFGTWFSNLPSSASGTPTQANYSFDILYGPIGGVTNGDTIYYYIAAEDSVGGNLTSQRPLAIGTNVNTITNEPTVTDFYNLLPTISAGSKFYVGSGQTYTTLSGVGGLFEFLNNNTIGGSITAVITSNIVEPGSISLNQLGEDGPGSGTFTITIRPDSSTTSSRVLSGNAASGLIRLNGADRIKILGVPDLSSNNNLNLLTIRNSSTSAPAVLFTNGTTQCRLNNLTIESSNTTSPLVVNGGVVSFAGNTGLIGNSQDSITNCIIRNDQSLTFPSGIPAGLINSFHSGTVLNSNNVITGCNFLNASSVYLNVDGGSGNGWVVANNSFYNNLPLITANPLSIRFNGGAISEGHTITNNFIGGTTPLAGGSSWNSSVLAAWNCIQIAVGNNLTTQISNNTIRNIKFVQTSSGVQWNGILVTSGRTNIIGNMIGDSTIVGSIELAPPTTHNAIAINTTVTVPTVISNNRIAGIFMNSPGNFVSFTGITVSGGITTISGNIVGSVTGNNSIVNNANGTTRGINVTSTVNTDPSVQIIGNTIANINASGAQTSVSLGGIQMTGSTVANISNNRVFNLSTLSSNTSLSSTACAIFGISVAGTTNAGPIVNNNVIYNISAANNSPITSNASGLLVQSANALRVSNNRIYDIRNLSTSNAVNPMPTASGVVLFNVVNFVDLMNNQITLGNNQTNNVQFNGIWLQTSSSFDVNAYYNTVLVTGSVASGSLASYAFHRGANSTFEVTSGVNLINNAFINNRSGGSTKNYAIANEVAGTPFGSGWLNVNYNFLSSANASTVGLWGTADLNLASWITTTNTSRNSWSEISSIVNPSALFTDIANGNLNVNTAASQNWYLNGKGIAGLASANINTDFIGSARTTTLGFGTDIGAHEFNSTSIPPAATINGVPSANSTTTLSFAGRTLATINWGATGTFPSSLLANYYSGINPPSVSAGTRFMNAYLQIGATGGSGYTYQITLNYDPALIGTVQGEGSLRVARRVTSWLFDASSIVNTTQQTVSTAGANNAFGIFTGTDLNAPLPVELANLNGKVVGNDAQLNWITVSERNNRGFEVERSADGVSFEYIGFVKGNINSNVKKDYSFTDGDVFISQQTAFYRLKQVDLDGKFEYSDVIKLNTNISTNTSTTIYPNPFTDKVTLSISSSKDENAEITVWDINGRLLLSKTITTNSTITNVNLDEMANFEGGVYFVKVAQASYTETHKVVNIK